MPISPTFTRPAYARWKKRHWAYTEFVTISYWESVEAMSRFTGGDPTKIHHLPRDEEFLIELPRAVQILEIVAAKSPGHFNRLVDRAD